MSLKLSMIYRKSADAPSAMSKCLILQCFFDFLGTRNSAQLSETYGRPSRRHRATSIEERDERASLLVNFSVSNCCSPLSFFSLQLDLALDLRWQSQSDSLRIRTRASGTPVLAGLQKASRRHRAPTLEERRQSTG